MKNERWLPIPGTKGIYLISDYGRVWRCEHEKETTNQYGLCTKKMKGLLLKPSLNDDGYLLHTQLPKRGAFSKFVARLVAQSFVPNPENKPEVDHLDRNRTNNHYTNLRWCTRVEQMVNTASREKTWKFINPNGTAETIINLRKFCRANPHLNQAAMLRVHQGKNTHHKGWTKNND